LSTLKIAGQTISFPEVNQSPNWAPSVIRFAKATETALNASFGGYDKASQTQVLNDSFKTPNLIGLALNSLIFKTSEVSSYVIYYTVTRDTTVPTTEVKSEEGKIEGLTGLVYQYTRDASGDANVDFRFDDSTGQLYILNNLAYTTGVVTVTYRASAISK
jgi:hypothetical protein